MIIGDIIIHKASTVKKILINMHDRNYTKGSNMQRLAFVKLFQCYQSRIFGVCVYRNKNNNRNTWKNFFTSRPI